MRTVQVLAAGSSVPHLVLTGALDPDVGTATTTVALDVGTAWVRGDLPGGGLTGAHSVAVAYRSGSLEITGTVTLTGDTLEVTGPPQAVLTVEPRVEPVTPVPGGCDAATTMPPPTSLTLTLAGSDAAFEHPGAAGEVWGQTLALGPPEGTVEARPGVGRLLLVGPATPDELDTGTVDAGVIDDGVIVLSGTATVARAGLALPVLSGPPRPDRGEVSDTVSWLLDVRGLAARWYDDPRPHDLGDARLEIVDRIVTLTAGSVTPLDPPVSQMYELWGTTGGGGARLPWTVTHAEPFALTHRCDPVDGARLSASARMTTTLDRPVTTAGGPLATPTTAGTIALDRAPAGARIRLDAAWPQDPAVVGLALRNALVWAAPPTAVILSGRLDGRTVPAGTLRCELGVRRWAPTLPDPYVTDSAVRVGDLSAAPLTGRLEARVTWTTPADVVVDLEGELGRSIAVEVLTRTNDEPRPSRPGPDDPDPGLTQTEQGTLGRDDRGEEQWAQAQEAAAQGWEPRVTAAAAADHEGVRAVDGFVEELLGPLPRTTLLDVSGHQDLLGVAVGEESGAGGAFPVVGLDVLAEVGAQRVVALPQVQWEPVRTLDADQDLLTAGWFPTPLASATDGGATHLGARYQELVPVGPATVLDGTVAAFARGNPVAVRTTFPFGLIGAVAVRPRGESDRTADLYGLTRPAFGGAGARGGLQVTAQAEGGRIDDGAVSPTFDGRLHQLRNGVELATGRPQGISVLGSTAQPAGSVETLLDAAMAARPRAPVTRLDVSGYGGSSFSDWNDRFAAYAEVAQVAVTVVAGRAARENVTVSSVLHPWGVRVTRSVTVERGAGGGVLRRDGGWQAVSPGLFDYRHLDATGAVTVPPYRFDAGVFRGVFDVRSVRPAPGAVFGHGTTTLVPVLFDADVALEGVPGRTRATGILGYLQTAPSGEPADPAALRALLEAQGPVGGPLDAWMDLGGSGLPFRVQRIEVGLALDGTTPVFVATARGVPRLPTTGAWSVVTRPVAGAPPGGGGAVPVGDRRGVPVIRRYPVEYAAGDTTAYPEPPLVGAPGPHRMADAADLFTQGDPATEYALLQSTPTHAFLFPRPVVPAPGTPRLETVGRPAVADILARATSKAAFPPPENTVEIAPGSRSLLVGPGGTLALDAPITVVGHPTPLRLAGAPGHGVELRYDTATLTVRLEPTRWGAELAGLRTWTDVAGLAGVTGLELRIVGSTDQRPQIAELRTLLLAAIEDILRYIPLFGNRGVQGPVDLAVTNAAHEVKVDVRLLRTVPPTTEVFPAGAGVELTLSVTGRTGFDVATGGLELATEFGTGLEGRIPLFSVGAVAVFLLVSAEVTFGLTSVAGAVTEEELELTAMVGMGVEGKIGPFDAYAFLAVGFVLNYDAVAAVTRYGGVVALEAGVDLVVVNVKIRAELKGLVYDDAGETKCDYGGSVKIQVELFLFLSIDASYEITETATL